jgi:hypothetical protein
MAVIEFRSTEKLTPCTACVVPLRVTKLTLKSVTFKRLID